MCALADEEPVEAAGVERRSRRLPQPSPQAVLAALEALDVGRPVGLEEEAGGRWVLEKVLVHGGGERRFVPEHEGRRGPDGLDVALVEPDEGRQLAHEPTEVGQEG